MSSSPASQGPPMRTFSLGQMVPSLIVNAVCPYVLYQVLSARGVPTIPALSATSIFPIGDTIFSWVRTRHADAIGIISLVFIVIGIVTSFASGDVHFYLIKESFVTGLFGLGCLVSLLLSRPIMFYLSRQFATGGDPERITRWDGLWQYPRFRHGMKLLTAVWGLGYVAEALVRAVLAYTVAPAVVIAVSPILALVVTIALIAWTVRYSQGMRRRGEDAGVGV